MRHFTINITWEKSQFIGSVCDEHGVVVVDDLYTSDFNEFIEWAEECIDILVPYPENEEWSWPDWYKNKEYDFTIQFSDVATLLKAFSAYVPLATLSKATHINKGQLSHYGNRLKVPRESKRDHIINTFHKIGERLCNFTIK